MINAPQLGNDEVREMAQKLAATTGASFEDAERIIRSVAGDLAPPSEAEMRSAALVMRLNACLAGRIFVPRRSVKRSVKG